MKAGDTHIDGLHHHLWIVPSDPALGKDRVVIASLAAPLRSACQT